MHTIKAVMVATLGSWTADDANYYGYFAGRGLASRLVLDGNGDVMAEEDIDGQPVVTDEDVVPLVDEMVAAHPAFSADGAKGLLAETGYEGLFGEHDLSDAAARGRVRRLVTALRATRLGYREPHLWPHRPWAGIHSR